MPRTFADGGVACRLADRLEHPLYECHRSSVRYAVGFEHGIDPAALGHRRVDEGAEGRVPFQLSDVERTDTGTLRRETMSFFASLSLGKERTYEPRSTTQEAPERAVTPEHAALDDPTEPF